MGRASRRKKERREQTKRGLSNPIARKAVAIASRSAVIKALSDASTGEQIEVLSNISPSKVGKAIMKKAPGEMDKGIRSFQRQGKKITVEGLLEEVRTMPSFLAMCENAGISYVWFQTLARERMQKHGIAE